MRKKKNIIILIIFVLTISLIFDLVSCQTEDELTQLNGNWNVTMIDDVELDPKDFIKGLPLINFDTVKGMISGNAGCNDFTGDAAYTENTIEIGDLITTKIACSDMETENRFLEILNNKIVKFNIDGDSLVLTGDLGGKLTLISKK